MIRSPATFAKVEKRYLTYSSRQIRVRCYRTVYASTKPLIQLFHSDERPVIGYSKLSCEHGLHGGCFSRSTPAGYCSLQQRSQKRPLSIGANFSSKHETRSTQETHGHFQAADIVSFDKGSAIRSHLKLWQEQHASKPEVVNLEKIPGFDTSGSVHNSVCQLGEIESSASSIANEADLELESEPEMDAEGHVGGMALDPHLLKGGDIVMMQNSQPAMVVRYIERYMQVYTVHGEIGILDPRSVYFAVQGVISSNELAPAMPHFPIDTGKDEAGKPWMETEVVIPRVVGAPLIDRMVMLISSADECFRNNAYRLDRAWEIMIHTKGSQVFSLEEFATKVFQQPSMSKITTAMLWCLYRSVIDDERILKDPDFHRVDPQFRLLSQEHYDDRMTVQKWVRHYQEFQASDTIASIIGESDSEKESRRSNPLYNFIRKAQIVVQKGRKIRSLTPAGQLGLSRVQSSPVGVLPPPETENPQHFDKDEMKILQYLIDWVLTRKIRDDTNSGSIGPAIIRATGLYDGLQFERSTGFLLLKELGVIMPWENRSKYYFNFPMPGLGVDPALDEMRKLANPPDLALKDSMKDLRKDWGDMPIFCIDSFDTETLDDGVSVEAIDDVSSWVHIHVANPSAFIDKDSAIAKYAARLSSTIYLDDGLYLMLESDKLRRHCSLAPGCPSITFSARMSFSGDILETKVTHGILNNIKRLTPETVNRYIYANDSSSGKFPIITVGGEWPANTEEEDQILTDSEIKALVKLRELGSARRLKRNAILFLPDSPSPKVDPGKAHPSFGIHSLGQCIVGDPLITMQLSQYESVKRVGVEKNSTELVSNLMILAGEVVAKWSAERGLPIAYSGTVGSFKVAREAFVHNVLLPAIKEHGCVPEQHFLHYISLLGHNVCSSIPLEHVSLNIPMYCKTTSPLRRWGDLFSHWQIDAAVRYEANNKLSLIGNTNDHFLPFSYSEAAEAIKEYDFNSRRCKILMLQSRLHWVAQWFHRAYYHEASLPKILTAYVTKLNVRKKNIALAVIKEVSIKCRLNHNAISHAEGGFEEGDYWEIEIDRVDIFYSKIYANPIRLLKKANIRPIQ